LAKRIWELWERKNSFWPNTVSWTIILTGWCTNSKNKKV
jgi:hypothetical protein